ncbi:uncharacterized protein F5Z01DRAFT_637246 [Emericellopsis atlantica]|uniref:Uncharacterized protein n=1 Tax=Emericellopsis atlantica TaxID=2614577 RepID=A0A9P8CNW3_9HYPO|nr:uncharacterized protein F5Z01DRAFT_637246 [Emericellopsis atlantica]KAG9253500.1 hypothetical protein F5Z01DRAFT_637246 [Emericellopsis atlantica]
MAQKRGCDLEYCAFIRQRITLSRGQDREQDVTSVVQQRECYVRSLRRPTRAALAVAEASRVLPVGRIRSTHQPPPQALNCANRTSRWCSNVTPDLSQLRPRSTRRISLNSICIIPPDDECRRDGFRSPPERLYSRLKRLTSVAALAVAGYGINAYVLQARDRRLAEARQAEQMDLERRRQYEALADVYGGRSTLEELEQAVAHYEKK